MLSASAFWGGGTIVFDRKHCHDRVYLAPYDDYMETGALGCASVIDAIHMKNSFTLVASI